MNPNPTLYDFAWDGQCDLGVWVQPTGTTTSDDWVLVEAMLQEADRDATCPDCGCAPYDDTDDLYDEDEDEENDPFRCHHECHGDDADTAEPWGWTPTGDYLLASAITLEPGDGVWVEGDDAPIFGAPARAALARLRAVEESPQVAVNEQQTALGIPAAIGGA